MTAITDDVAWLLDGIRRPGEFSVGGTCDLLAPRLEVEGVGPIALPLLPVQAEAIVAVAGHATRTGPVGPRRPVGNAGLKTAKAPERLDAPGPS